VKKTGGDNVKNVPPLVADRNRELNATKTKGFKCPYLVGLIHVLEDQIINLLD